MMPHRTIIVASAFVLTALVLLGWYALASGAVTLVDDAGRANPLEGSFNTDAVHPSSDTELKAVERQHVDGWRVEFRSKGKKVPGVHVGTLDGGWTQSDDGGFAHVAYGTATLRCVHAEYQPVVTELVARPDANGGMKTIALKTGAIFSGRVLDQDGVPVSGALVLVAPVADLLPTDDNQTLGFGIVKETLRRGRRGNVVYLARARSDSDGRFKIAGLRSVPHYLRIRKDGYVFNSRGDRGQSLSIARTNLTGASLHRNFRVSRLYMSVLGFRLLHSSQVDVLQLIGISRRSPKGMSFLPPSLRGAVTRVRNRFLKVLPESARRIHVVMAKQDSRHSDLGVQVKMSAWLINKRLWRGTVRYVPVDSFSREDICWADLGEDVPTLGYVSVMANQPMKACIVRHRRGKAFVTTGYAFGPRTRDGSRQIFALIPGEYEIRPNSVLLDPKQHGKRVVIVAGRRAEIQHQVLVRTLKIMVQNRDGKLTSNYRLQIRADNESVEVRDLRVDGLGMGSTMEFLCEPGVYRLTLRNRAYVVSEQKTVTIDVDRPEPMIVLTLGDRGSK